jgi:hypothetical protein
MRTIASSLIVASAAVVLLLGVIHLLYTFRGRKLHPRDSDLYTRMNEVSLVITRKTTMCKAWVGFNASHSYGAIFFGLVYGYLALAHSEFLFQSTYLLLLGLLLLVGYAVLGKLYWFSAPLQGILLSAVLYVAGLVLGWT